MEDKLISLSVFLGLLCLSTHATRALKQSPFIPWIVLGALLGPPLANFAPGVEGLKLAGFLGVTLSIAQAGLSTRLSQIRSCAPRAAVVALLGVIFPIGGACLVMLLFEHSSVKTAFAAGAAIAPTSLGVTAALLADVGELRTDIGVLISVAAIFDDVISLILLAELEQLAHITAWTMIQPILFSVLFITVSVLVTAFLFPWLFARFSAFFTQARYTRPAFYAFLIASISMMYAASRAHTSTLLAAYVAGVAFADCTHVQAAWTAIVQPSIAGLDALFFAATIGFEIPPLRELFDREAVTLGALLTIVSIAGKGACAAGMWPSWWRDGLPVAVAMLGRGEFGFLIAAQAKAEGFLNKTEYAAVTWAVMVPTLLGPILFRPAFNMRQKKIDAEQAVAGGQEEEQEGKKRKSVTGSVQDVDASSTDEDMDTKLSNKVTDGANDDYEMTDIENPSGRTSNVSTLNLGRPAIGELDDMRAGHLDESCDNSVVVTVTP